MLTRDTALRFDKSMRLKEDYDYTLQHLAANGRVARLDWILPEYQHYTNEGGAVAYRSPDEEQKAIAHLKEKWGPVIADNPKRPNEILLKWDREKHAAFKRAKK